MADIREQLQAIQHRADAADPAPWERATKDSVFLMAPADEHGTYVARTYPRTWSGRPTYQAEALASANAEFIAHARADVPRLVAAVRAVLDLLESRTHDSCDDGWYSCSQAVDLWDGHPSCTDPERVGKPCDCGRDWLIQAANKTITETLGGA